MKVLIINAVSIEESLLATPIIRLLKTGIEAEVHLAINKENKALFQNNPYIDELHDYSLSPFLLKKALKKHHFDWIIDLKNDLKSKIVRLGIASNVRVFKKNRFAHWLLTKFKINRLPNQHLSDQYVDLIKPLGIKEDNLGIDYFIDEKDEVENEWLPQTHQNGYAAIAISASHSTKKLPVNRLIELCDRINKPVVLVGNSSDEDVANEVEDFFKPGTEAEEKQIESLNKKTIIFNACGKFSFNQSAALVKNANWIFTYDNVMMHIAAAFKKHIYTIWGNTSPRMGTYPYRTQFTVFENNKLSCRPCATKGFANCPKGHFKCMGDLVYDFYLPD